MGKLKTAKGHYDRSNRWLGTAEIAFDHRSVRLREQIQQYAMEGEENLPFGSWRDGGKRKTDEGSKPEVSLVSAAGL